MTIMMSEKARLPEKQIPETLLKFALRNSLRSEPTIDTSETLKCNVSISASASSFVDISAELITSLFLLAIVARKTGQATSSPASHTTSMDL